MTNREEKTMKTSRALKRNTCSRMLAIAILPLVIGCAGPAQYGNAQTGSAPSPAPIGAATQGGMPYSAAAPPQVSDTGVACDPFDSSNLGGKLCGAGLMTVTAPFWLPLTVLMFPGCLLTPSIC